MTFDGVNINWIQSDRIPERKLLLSVLGAKNSEIHLSCFQPVADLLKSYLLCKTVSA